MTVDSYFTNTIAKDLYSMCVGEKLGEGAHRKVFNWLPDSSLVVKFEVGCKSFANVIEWETWNRVKHVKVLRDWFCPCVSISDCGSILLQKKAKVVEDKDLPKFIPKFFTDLKKSNFGKFGNKIVCVDYGLHTLMENGMTNKMKKAEWYDA
jgi:hypothetical protein